MFKRQKSDSPSQRKPEPGSGSDPLPIPAAEPQPRPSGMTGQSPGAASPMARPAATPLRSQRPGSDELPSLPNIVASARGLLSGADPTPSHAARRETSERRTLVVGHGISVHGTVQDAERLVVQGTVETSLVRAAELAVAAGGLFKGAAEVEDAEVAGAIEGTLTVRGVLVVRATGRIQGTAHCRRLQVEDGGQIDGQVDMQSEPSRSESTHAVMEPAD